MVNEYRLIVRVLDGPEARRGDRIYLGDTVELAAFASTDAASIPPQSCIVRRDGEGMLLCPAPGTHVRIGLGEPWREVKPVEGALRVGDGQLIYLGPIKRGLTVRLMGFQLPSKKVEPLSTGGFRPGVGLLFLVLALLAAWLLASVSY